MSNIKSRGHISVSKVNVICASNDRLTQYPCYGLVECGRYWDAIFDLPPKLCDVTFRWSLLVSSDFARFVWGWARIMWKNI